MKISESDSIVSRCKEIVSTVPKSNLFLLEQATKIILVIKLGTMIINKEARRVTINKKECLLRNAEFNLLCMFAEKSNHTLSREEIKNAFWKEEIGVDNRINNLISTLRNVLKHFEYQIIMDKEKGYILKRTKAKKENNKA